MSAPHQPPPESAGPPRICAACGQPAMEPLAPLPASALAREVEAGHLWHCPLCGHEAAIRTPAALRLAGLYSALWLAGGAWALWAGPLWYLRNPEWFAEGYRIDYILLDAVTILGGLGVAGLALWFALEGFWRPLRAALRHPPAGHGARARRRLPAPLAEARAWFDFLVMPLPFLGILIGLFLILERLGTSAEDHPAAVLGTASGAVILAWVYARRSGGRVRNILSGGLFWLTVALGVLLWRSL